MRVYQLTATELLSLPLASASLTLSIFSIFVDPKASAFALPSAILGAVWLAAIVRIVLREHKTTDSRRGD